MEKKVKFSDIVCASKVGAHLNNSLMELQLLMKDYTTVPIWGEKSVRSGNLVREIPDSMELHHNIQNSK